MTSGATAFRIDSKDGALAGWRWGAVAAPCVLCVPSFGRSVRDFDRLAADLAAAGFQVILPETRGIPPCGRPLDGLSQADLARDALAVLDGLGIARAHLVGHAFGNRVVRTAASLVPERIDSIILLAAGGAVAIAPEIRRALEDCFRLDMPEAERMRAVRLAFFAEGSDPSVWRDGWYPDVATAQMRAADDVVGGDWMAAGGRPILAVQPLEDKVAPPEASRRLRDRLGAQVTVADIAGAGHALLPEKPGETARILIEWLTARSGVCSSAS